MDYAPARFHKSERKLAEPGEPFAYTPENQRAFDELVTHYPPDRRKSAILYALFLVQEQQGYISRASMRFVAQQIGCTPVEVEDVVSYYVMFFTRPVGKYVLSVCRTLSCALNGAERVTEAFSKELGIRPGQTDSSRTFTLTEFECLGVMITNDHWQDCLKPEAVPQFIQDLRTRGLAALSGCIHKVEK
jgi:NADH-quinone oxidoreductase subunit E